MACMGAALLVNLVNGTSIAAVIWLQERRNALNMVAGMMTTGALNVLATTGLAIVAFIVIERDPWATLALVPLVATLRDHAAQLDLSARPLRPPQGHAGLHRIAQRGDRHQCHRRPRAPGDAAPAAVRTG